MVKRAAKQLMVKESARFTGDFNHNKRVLGGNTMPSKPIRNKIAGYLARLVKMKAEEAKRAAMPKPVIVEEEAPQYQQY